MSSDDSAREHTWTTRKTQPVIALYVLAVFIGFMALAYFGFHSRDAVRALFLAAIGALVSLAPGILTRFEYRLTDTGLRRRAVSEKEPRPFQELFSWEELARLVPTSTGFRYFKKVGETSPFRRFLRFHVSGGHSGEIHVEEADRTRIRALLESRAIPIERSSGGTGLEPGGSG